MCPEAPSSEKGKMETVAVYTRRCGGENWGVLLGDLDLRNVGGGKAMVSLRHARG